MSKKLVSALALATFLGKAHLAQAQEANPAPGLFVSFASNDAVNVIVAIVQVLLGMIGAITIMYIIYGGFLYLTSGMNSAQTEHGKKTVTHALTGLIIVILSYIIVRVVVNSFSAVPNP